MLALGRMVLGLKSELGFPRLLPELQSTCYVYTTVPSLPRYEVSRFIPKPYKPLGFRIEGSLIIQSRTTMWDPLLLMRHACVLQQAQGKLLVGFIRWVPFKEAYNRPHMSSFFWEGGILWYPI